MGEVYPLIIPQDCANEERFRMQALNNFIFLQSWPKFMEQGDKICFDIRIML